VALKDFADRINQQHAIRVQLDPDLHPKRPIRRCAGSFSRPRTNLVMNVLKHAKASDIRIVTRKRTAPTLRVSVQDNGIGFDAAQAAAQGTGPEGGFGLFSIRERLEELGGRLEVQSQPGRGATVDAKRADLPGEGISRCVETRFRARTTVAHRCNIRGWREALCRISGGY